MIPLRVIRIMVNMMLEYSPVFIREFLILTLVWRSGGGVIFGALNSPVSYGRAFFVQVQPPSLCLVCPFNCGALGISEV